MQMRVVFQQADMDTTLTAWLLGVAPSDEVVHVEGRADAKDLLNAHTVCIECGGSGQVHLRNFDHHDTSSPLPPACRQAYDYICYSVGASGSIGASVGKLGPTVDRLVNYVATIDEFGPQYLSTSPRFPTLSQLFSGLRLSVFNPIEQLHSGVAVFNTIFDNGLDPNGGLPLLSHWQSWLQRRLLETERLANDLNRIQFYRTKRGYLLGYLQSNCIGALGAMYNRGCDLAIANRRLETADRWHYRIGSKSLRLELLLEQLRLLELGWGGPSRLTILGAPREGSAIVPREVVDITRRHS